MKEYITPQIICFELRAEEQIAVAAPSECRLTSSGNGACPSGQAMCYIGFGS